MNRILPACALTALLASSASAATWLVNPDGTGDFPTIQAALAAAADGDEILLADGTFTGDGNRDLRFLGKNVTVRSASGDAAACVIDVETWNAHGFRFLDGEGPLSVLENVTVTRANRVALYLDNASPTIRGVILRDCPDGGVLTQGGSPRLEDLECREGGVPALELLGGAPVLTGCLLEANTLVSSRGALRLSSCDATIEQSVFRNHVRGDASSVSVIDASSGHVVLRDCEFTGNPAPAVSHYGSVSSSLTLERCLVVDHGNAIRFSTPTQGPQGTLVLRDCDLRGDRTSLGNGIRIGGRTKLTLERCTIEDFGRGVWAPVSSSNPELSLTVRDCRINGNVGHGLYVQNPRVEIDGSEIRGNGTRGAELRGAGQISVLRDCLVTGNGRIGLLIGSFTSATIERSTVASNGDGLSGTGIEIRLPAAGTLHLARTIVWDNCSADGSEIIVPAGSVLELDCVDLDPTAIRGDGTVIIAGDVLDTDPLFCDPVPCGVATSEGRYTLIWGSPALLAACGPIGALDAGCDAPTAAEAALELRSWGAIKSLYR